MSALLAASILRFSTEPSVSSGCMVTPVTSVTSFASPAP